MKNQLHYSRPNNLFNNNRSVVIFRKATGILFFVLMLFGPKSFGQIAAWDFNGGAGSEVTVAATTLNANLNATSVSRGAGIDANPLANTYSSTNFAATSISNAHTLNEYIQFTIKANSSYQVSLSTLDANFRRSSTGPNNFQWEYSLDGFSTAGVNIGSAISYNLTTSNGDAQAQINLTGISALQNVSSTTTITIRLYASGATATGGTFSLGRPTTPLNDLAIGGTVTLVPLPPAKFAVTTITPSTPTSQSTFNVTVVSQDVNSTLSNVSANTDFILSTNGNAGTIGGTTTGTILVNTNTIVVSGVTLSSTGAGVTITATYNNVGNNLSPGTSNTFNVLPVAPVAVTANPIGSTSFTALWGGVTGATGYRLDVLSSLPYASEDFTDGNFTAAPAWAGSTGSYSVLTNSTLPSGAANTDGSFLGCNSSVGITALYTPATETNQWQFSLGSPDFAPSSGNYFGVVLMSDNTFTSNSSSFNGYYIRIGVDGATDNIELWKSTGLAKTQVGLYSGGPNLGANALRDGLNLKITRSAGGIFEVFYSTGFLYSSTPVTSAGTLTDNTYSSSSYFGVYSNFANPAATRRVYIDNITVSGMGGDVYVPNYIDLTVAGTSQIVNIGISPNTTYYYRSRAVSAGGTSANSNTITVTTTNESIADYRSVANGNYSDASTWEYQNASSTWVAATQGPGSNNNVTIQSGNIVTLTASATIGSGKTLTVNGTLNCAANVVSGAGTFTLASGATLGVGHANGLSTNGNIQTTTRNFNSGANLNYNGTVPQITGVFTATPTAGQMNDIAINNTSGVTLSTDFTFHTITFANGTSFHFNSKALHLTGDFIDNGCNFFDPGSMPFEGTSLQTIGGLATDHNLNNVDVIVQRGLPNSLSFGGGTIQMEMLSLTLTSGTFNAGNVSISLAGNWTNNGGVFIPGTSTVIFNGSSNSTMSGTVSTQTFYKVEINKSGGASLIMHPQPSPYLSDWQEAKITSGVFNIGISSLTIHGDWINNVGTIIPNTSTVTFGGGTSSTISSTAATNNFYNVQASQPITIIGPFDGNSQDTHCNIGGSINFGQATWRVAGDFINDGSINADNSTIIFNGTSNQNIGGTNATAFNNLTMNNTAGVTLSGVDASVSGVLDFTSGKITTGANTLELGNSAIVSGAGPGKYVYGKLQVDINATGSKLFAIGDATVYAPIDFTMNSLINAGSFTAVTTPGANPNENTPVTNASGINQSAKVNRQINFLVPEDAATGSATLQFHFSAAEATGNPLNYVVRKFESPSTWSATTTGTQAATSTEVTGLTSFGEFEIGEPNTLSVLTNPTNPAEICAASGTSTFTASSNSLPAPSVQWQQSTGGPFSNITNSPLYNGTTTGTLSIINPPASMNGYQYRAVFTNINGSTNSTAATLTVSSGPPGIVTGGFTAPASACATNVSLITVTAVSGQNIHYSWQTGSNSSVVLFSTNIGGPFSAGPFSTPTNQVYAQFGAVGPGQSGYDVCVQGVNACGSTTNRCIWIRGVVNGPGPITPANGVVACQNTNQLYSCGTSGGATVYTWTLNGSTAPISPNMGNNPTNVTVSFPNGFTSGQLCVTAALACGGSSTSAPRCITVSNNPANPNVPTGAATVCPGAPGVPYSIPAVTGASGYSWTVPANATIATGLNSPSITVNFPTPFTGSSSVCVTTTSSCGASVVKCKTVVSGIPNQPAGITGPLANVCASTVQYVVVAPIGGLTYTWTYPPGTTLTGQGSTPVQVAFPSNFTSGVLTVTATSATCPSTPSAARTSSTIWGRPNNAGAITQYLPGPFCPGAGLNFSVVNQTPAATYTWTSSNGSITAGQGSNVIDVTWGNNLSPGTITVRAGNGCGLSAGTNSATYTAISCRQEGINATSETAFSVYPNPAHDKITVSIDVNKDTEFNIKLMDLAGRVILSENQSALSGFNTYELSLSNIVKGIYMLEIISAPGTPGATMNNWKSKVAVE